MGGEGAGRRRVSRFESCTFTAMIAAIEEKLKCDNSVASESIDAK
jgi:hypothetical protein